MIFNISERRGAEEDAPDEGGRGGGEEAVGLRMLGGPFHVFNCENKQVTLKSLFPE